MNETPKGLRLHIGIFGRRNVGKSSLLNALSGQSVSIVSEYAGTTTDPVEKVMELAPLGPVVLVDTAGIDDEGAVGDLRIQRTMNMLERMDMAILVTETTTFGSYEEQIATLLKERSIPFFVALNKADLAPVRAEVKKRLEGGALSFVEVATGETVQGIDALRQMLIATAPEDWAATPPLLADLLHAGATVLLVVPIDTGAPKGRLILPQVQAIRDALDASALCLVVKENAVRDALAILKTAPALVVCDSQTVKSVAADTPRDIPLTTFSILMARLKGDLSILAAGAAALGHLHPNDKVLIAEACSHHAQTDDIGRVKIPRMMAKHVGGALDCVVAAGKDYPDNLADYKLILHCGACVITRRHMLTRLYQAQRLGIPVTNYGIAISEFQGVLERTLAPFPAAWHAYTQACRDYEKRTQA